MKFMVKKVHSNYISLIFMILITVITQITILMKSSIVAGLFGVSSDMDAYNFANSIVTFLFGFIVSGVQTVVIPYYVHKESKESINTFITMLYGVILTLVIALIIFRYPIISLLSNREDIFIELICHILVISLIANFLISFTNITTAYFQCCGKYNTPKIITLISSVIVICILSMSKNITIIQYSVIIAMGLSMNFFVDIYFALKNGWRYTPCLKIKDQKYKELLKLFIPIIYSSGIYRLSLFIDAAIASRLATGRLTVLNYSTQIAGSVNTVLIGNLLIYAYPKIVANIKEKNSQKDFWGQVILFHLICCAIITGFVAVGQEGIAILFQHGKFGADSTRDVFIGSLIYIVGQQSSIVRDLIYRYFYAKCDTKTVAKNSVFVSISNITISIILVKIIGFYGIILGTILASALSLIKIAFKFKEKIGFEIPVHTLIIAMAKNIIIALTSIGVVLVTKWIFPVDSNILSALIFGFEAIIVFIAQVLLINRGVLGALKTL